MSTHLNYCATIGGLIKIEFNVQEGDIHHSCLSLAHVFERETHWCLMGMGGKIGYYQGDISKIKEDLAES